MTALDHSGGVAFRVPLLPLETLAAMTGGAARRAWEAGGDVEAAVRDDRDHLDGALRRLLAGETVRAALAYASPSLDDAVGRWLGDGGDPPPGLLGYVCRMSGRCAPFGLFASCASGEVEGAPAFRLGDETRVRARMDVAAAEALANAGATAYVPNSTLHRAAGRLRMVEREGGRYHPLAVDTNDAIDAVLAAARDGAALADLARLLVDDEVTFDEALAFVAELADAQLLVPDAPVVTGEIPAGDGHVDASRPGTFVLGDAVLAEAYRAVGMLHTLHRETPVDADLAAFKAAFRERYGDVEMPLLEVLDPELGIGYGAPPAVAVAGAPLLAGFNPAPSTDGPVWTPIDHHLLDLLSRALRDGDSEIELPPRELHSLRNQRPRPLPPSVALLATVVAADADAVARGDFLLVANEVTGPNAVALFSRFADVDEGLGALARRHVEEEERRVPDATLAEVVHLPERRDANVAVRPALRRHEIPVLAASAAAPGDRVLPGDLTVSVVDDRVVLRDRAGREVLPRLSAAHEPRTSALPLYRFLGAVQGDGVATPLRWSWGQMDSAPYLPRVVMGRVVLARAQWRWFRPELVELRGARTPAARYAAVQRLRDYWRVPRWATLARGAYEIPVDLDGVAATELLAREARNAGQLWLRELLPGPDELVLRGREGGYAHEVVLPLHAPAPAPAGERRPPRRAASTERVAVRVTCGPATADAVLREVVATEPWWFERTPEGLRLVLATADAEALRAEGARETYRPAEDDGVAYADTALALRLLAGGLDARWRAALWGVDRLLADAGLDLAARRDEVTRRRDRLVTAYGETGDRARRHAGRIARERRADLDGPDAALAAMLDERSRVTEPLLRGAGAHVLETACAAHVNRVLRAAHDLQRIVLYDLLERYYRRLRATGRSSP